MSSRHWLGCLSVALGFLSVGDPTVIAEDRLEEFQKLSQAYEAADKEFVERELPDKPSQEQLIQRWDDFPAWSYLPRFLKMAEAQPDDDVAFRCCLWILDRTRNVGNWTRKFIPSNKPPGEFWPITTRTGRNWRNFACGPRNTPLLHKKFFSED